MFYLKKKSLFKYSDIYVIKETARSSSVDCERLKPHVIRIVGYYQCVFMFDRGT